MKLHARPLRMLLPPLTAVPVSASVVHAQAAPVILRGSWRITRMLPTAGNTPCWDADRAKTLLGSTLVYRDGALVWQSGAVEAPETIARTLAARRYQDEYRVSFAELGIRAAEVIEYDLQHEDADIAGGSTEVPGDTVLAAGPGRIVVSACGVYFAAVRAASATRCP